MSKCKAWWKSWETLQNLKKKTKGSKWAKIFTISMPKRPPVAARTSSQSMQLIVLHVQHSALDSSEIETYCDLLWLVEIFTSKYQYGLAKEALRSSIYVKFGVPRAHLVWEEIQGMVQLIPKEVDEGKPHLSTKQIYIYIYRYIFAWRREDPESTSC